MELLFFNISIRLPMLELTNKFVLKRKEVPPSTGNSDKPLLDLGATCNEASNKSPEEENEEVPMSLRGFNSKYMKFELERL